LQLPCGQSCFDLIRNLFALDIAALSRVKQLHFVLRREEKNMLGKSTTSLQCRVAQMENE